MNLFAFRIGSLWGSLLFVLFWGGVDRYCQGGATFWEQKMLHEVGTIELFFTKLKMEICKYHF